MIVAAATQKMIECYSGSIHDIDHFLKVWAMAKTIGELEGLDRHTQEVLELAAVVHDIACPLCREKYGNTSGKNQELESPALVEAFFAELPVERSDAERISWLVAHHHTYTNVDDLDLLRRGLVHTLQKRVGNVHGIAALPLWTAVKNKYSHMPPSPRAVIKHLSQIIRCISCIILYAAAFVNTRAEPSR